MNITAPHNPPLLDQLTLLAEQDLSPLIDNFILASCASLNAREATHYPRNVSVQVSREYSENLTRKEILNIWEFLNIDIQKLPIEYQDYINGLSFLRATFVKVLTYRVEEIILRHIGKDQLLMLCDTRSSTVIAQKKIVIVEGNAR